jgi:hypothetical protein
MTALDAKGKAVTKGRRVKSVVGALHETMQFYGRVDDIQEGTLLIVTKENPGNECPRTRSAAHLWVLVGEKEKAPVYPTTEPWTMKGELARAAKAEQERQRFLKTHCGACGRPNESR